jgi:hypothetical protein
MQYRPHRYPTKYPTPIRTPRGVQQGDVVDVNTIGAMVRGLSGVKRGDKLELDVLSCKLNAVVQWASKDHAGIAFRPQLTDHIVDTLCRRPTGNLHGRGSVGFGYAEMR